MTSRERLESLASSRRVPEEVNAIAIMGLALADALAARPDPVAKFLDDLRLTEAALRSRVEVRRKNGEWLAETVDGRAAAFGPSPAEALSSLGTLAVPEPPP